MSNTTMTETGISYGTTDNMKAVLIGKDSKFEISTEKREFEGINKIQAIEEIPTIKITFFQLTDNLITYLADSAMAANGVRFWNKTGLHDGIYQSFYEQDEFKQTATLTLYFCYSLVHEASWEGSLIELGMPRIFTFGFGDLKINSFEFPQNRINAEKSINIDVEKIKFGNKYRYFISSKSSYKITINDLSISGITLEHLAALKNSMIEFTPHIDRPDKTYSNLYLSYEVKEENNIISAEVSLKAISDQTNQDFIFAPSIYQSGDFIMMTAGAGAKIYYTYGAAPTPSNPVPGNWTEYTAPVELANGFYKAVAVLNGNYSGITEKQITAIIVSKPVLLVVDNKLQMTADSNAEIFYNSNKYSLPGEPGAGSSKYPGTPIDLVYAYYKAIAKLNGLWSNVTSDAISPSFIPAPNIWKYTENTIKMECSLTDAEIFYTTDGSVPTVNSTKYTQPIPFAYGEYKAVAKLVNTSSETYVIKWQNSWSPANITTSLWLDANDDSTITKDGSNLVSSWNDKSGNNRNAIAVGSIKPIKKTVGILFDSNGNRLEYPRLTTVRCAIILHKWTNLSGYYRVILGDNLTYDFHGSASEYTILSSHSSPFLRNGNKYVNGILTSGDISKPTSYSTVIFNTTGNITVNNIAQDRSWDDRVFLGSMLELILLEYVPSDRDRLKIEGYLAWKWDTINGNNQLVNALPSNHAYKTSPPSQ